MKRVFSIRRVSTAALIVWGGLAGVKAENTVAVNDVLKLKDAGVNENTIVAFIQGKNLNYDLSADNVLTLREKGVTPAVLNAMLASGNAATSVAPAAVTTNFTSSTAPVTAATPVQVPNAPTVASAPVVNAAPAYAPVATTPTVTVVSPSPAANPDVAYFYQELSPYGRWLVAEDGQWYWQPSVVVATPTWRPYYDNGRWVLTDSGWYWSSDYPWGWAAFHYGRWHLHPRFGWVWLPDRVWGPGWVVWRSDAEYCGWAPLPPGAVFDVAHARFMFRGRAVAADFDFGLGWMHFNFCYVRELGEPLHWRPHGEPEIRRVFDRTRPIGGFRVGKGDIHGEPREHFINVGVESQRVVELRGRPMEPMKIRDLRAPVPGGAPERMDPKGRTLETYRPQFGDRGDRGPSKPKR